MALCGDGRIQFPQWIHFVRTLQRMSESLNEVHKAVDVIDQFHADPSVTRADPAPNLSLGPVPSSIPIILRRLTNSGIRSRRQTGSPSHRLPPPRADRPT